MILQHTNAFREARSLHSNCARLEKVLSAYETSYNPSAFSPPPSKSEARPQSQV